jgi:DNA mismatch repair protein MutL
MSRIRVLPEQVANQIAAGEVVERPASVVKELVENALDAGATRLQIAIDGGGADRIRVTDDGSGMDREDARLSLERHATSKIREAGDLQGIGSFGFRGEALPSIASVSRFLLTTSTGGQAGTRIRVAGGRASGPEPAPHPRGTTVEVEHLFYNAPARRKFLRSPATEAARIAEVVATTAAARPDVSFRLDSGGRTLASFPAVATLIDRVGQILGPGEATALQAVEDKARGLRLSGLISRPSLHRSTSRDIHLYVNGRPIRDRRLLHAVQEAYATLLPSGRYPVVWLSVGADPGEVDVNVHPAKSEVRFQRPAAVHDLVRGTLRRALGAARPVADLALRGPASQEGERSDGEAPPVPLRDNATRVSEDPIAWVEGTGEGGGSPAGPGDAAVPLPATAALFDTLPLAPLAQFRETYILASARDGLVILDQHAAHERILYERLVDGVRAGGVPRQRLLFPLILEASPAQIQALEGAGDLLDGLGFDLAPFGPTAVRVEETPSFLPAAGLDRLVRGILDEILEWDRPQGIEQLRHRLAASAACHAAVTAHQALAEPEMQSILTDLARSRSPMTCPHGRPALLRLPLSRIEREFHRR